MLRCRQHKFETNQEYFERFKNATGVITQYDGPIGKDTGLISHIGSEEDAQEKFLAVGMVQKSDELR